MADPIWLLGPSGDLRPLICPERDITITPVRYGGVRQGLSGARSMDITGHRLEYNFKWSYLDQQEYRWYEAMHYRMMPGPFRMIDPLKKNRLTAESSMGKIGAGTAQGIELTNGIVSREYAYPTGLDIGNQSSKWTNRSTTAVIRHDKTKRTTVFPGETITASIWLRSSLSTNMTLVFDWYDRTAILSSSTTVTAAMTNTWTRFSITRTVPAGAHSAIFACYFNNTTSIVNFTGAQVESGGSATSWELGGGAPIVHIDQLTGSSPRAPYRNIEMTLLEA